MSFTASLQELQSQSAQQWLDRATRTLPKALSVALVIAIAWQLVQLTWLLLEPAPQLDTSPIQPSANIAPRPKGVDVQTIVNAKLFGTAQATAPVAGPAPETQLNLVLSAVFATEQPERGMAIIGESAQQTKVYSTGDTIRPGIRLHAVYPDRVILDRSGSLETLALPRRNLAMVMTPPRPRARRSAESGHRKSTPRRRNQSDRLRGDRSSAAGVREWGPARLSRLPRPQPSAIREIGLAAGRSRTVDQRHTAR